MEFFPYLDVAQCLKFISDKWKEICIRFERIVHCWGYLIASEHQLYNVTPP
jgi:hypothetical protein